MPSARSSQFVDSQTLMDEANAGVPVGRDARSLPPASTGLRAPAGKSGRADKRASDEHPAPSGPIDAERAERLAGLVMRMVDKLSPREIAIEAGVSTNGRAVREVIRAARKSLAERAEFYVEAHAIATIQAAIEGDAKPSQWALERIAEQGEHIVDPEQTEKPSMAPQFNIGFNLGGVPQPAVVTPKTIEGEVVKP